MGGQIKLRIRFKTYVGNWFDYLLVSRKELVRILDGTGWEIDEIYESAMPFYVAIIKKSN